LFTAKNQWLNNPERIGCTLHREARQQENDGNSNNFSTPRLAQIASDG
jgi:hypothetical protein